MLIMSLRSPWGCQQNPSMIVPAAGQAKRIGDAVSEP
jgi:hypothetical protein